MLLDQSLVWNEAYKLRWDGGTCVKGSSGEPSAVTGDHTGYVSSTPPESASNFFGANITWSYPGAYKVDSHPPKPLTTPSSTGGKSATTTGKATSGAVGLRSMMLLAENGPGGVLSLLLSPLLAIAALLCVL